MDEKNYMLGFYQQRPRVGIEMRWYHRSSN